MKAGSLTSHQLQGLLNASYDKKIRNIDGFKQDRSLSTKTSKVYVNPETGQTVVAHRGTAGITDWGNNLVYALGGRKAYKHTSRFKEAQSVQRKAESKYGKEHISTIGHSQGGLQAELLGRRGKETITLNKATRPFANTPAKNQTDIRTQNDLVSALNPFQSKKDSYLIESNLNPLSAHSIDTLERTNEVFGKGIKLKMGGNNVTSSDDIDKMSKNIVGYKGCFTKEELPKIQNGFYVINLNGHSHWTCLMKKGDRCFYYDSFGFPAQEEIENKMGEYIYNGRDNQDLDSTSCGFYCIAFMKFMQSQKNPIKAFQTFVQLFDDNTKNNDAILKVLIES